ncbi:hypothetical protein [Thiothrix nivea]|uniref:Uncharacterized protein n=1 Tax=Thiothrix nivea (strain ATCC 35100 / DSM 5205 / JP2) TaxID=870187 RepID=A0A656H9N1_THINJ|nr:hypothetical protein [Thiothrix nivea]EIJ33318.1 hypothetical protein Thini_0681 [Thiothrix nivea DSM 5205]
MARIIVGLPPETEHQVDVMQAGVVADAFVAVWATPDDDQALEIRELRVDSLTPVAREDDPEDLLARFRLHSERLRQRRAGIDAVISRHFLRATDPEYEDGDLQRMLPHDIYRAALLYSLWQVANGEALAKNSVTPGTTTAADAYPADQAET